MLWWCGMRGGEVGSVPRQPVTPYEIYLSQTLRHVAAMGIGTGCVPTLERPVEGHFVRPTKAGLELVYTERGQESVERFARVEDLVFTVVRGAAASHAQAVELRCRRPGEDTRRQWFALQVELVERADAALAERLRTWQAEILARHPFVDPPAGATS
jgi:hypothetical protein